jgi:hypothetical protein
MGAALAAAANSPAAHQDIQIGTVVLRVPLPAGFCKPTGQDAAVMQLLTASDSRNITHASFVECKDTSAHRYIQLKTPVQVFNADLDLAETLKSMAEALEEPELAAKFQSKDFRNQIGEEKSKVLGAKTELSGEFGPRGHDEVCVYLGGLVTTTINDATETQAAATCMTVVGKRMISINQYEDTTDPKAYETLMGKARQLALKIRVVP